MDRLLSKAGLFRSKAFEEVAKQKGYGAVVDSQFFMRGMTLSEALAHANSNSYSTMYSKDVYVYAAIYSCAVALSHVPFRFYTGTDLERDTVENSPYDALFDRPNPIMSKFQLWEATEIYLKLRGECMWVLEFGGQNPVGNIPKEIYPIDPCQFEPVIDPRTKMLVAWIMRQPGTNEKVYLEHGTEVIQFKKYNPYNPLRGLSGLEAAARSIRMGQNVRMLNDSIMENGAEPGGVITTDQPLTLAQMTQIRDGFEQRHTGAANARRTAILHSGLKYQQVAMTPEQMAFEAVSRLSVEDILAVLKVPKTEVFKYDDVRKETAEVQDRALWTKNLLPEMMYIEDELYAQFFSRRGPKTMWGLFDTSHIHALQDSFDTKFATAKTMFDMGWPLNEINKRLDLGMKPVPWGDVGYLPFSIVPADMVGAKAEADLNNALNPPASQPQEAPPPKSVSLTRIVKHGRPGQRWTKVMREQEPVVKAVVAEVVPDRHAPLLKAVDKAVTRAKREAAWQAFVSSVQHIETRFHSKLRRFLFEMRQDVLDRVFAERREQKNYAIALHDIFEKAKPKLQAFAKVFYSQAAKVGGERIATFGIDFNLDSTPMQHLIAERTGRITGIVDTVERQLRENLNEGVKLGESVSALAGRVRDTFNMASGRALTIARTEVLGAANQAGFQVMRENQVEKVMWVTAGDELVRETHAEQDGETVQTGDTFKNGLQYPGQQAGDPGETINCRCTTVPVIEKAQSGSVKKTLPAQVTVKEVEPAVSPVLPPIHVTVPVTVEAPKAGAKVRTVKRDKKGMIQQVEGRDAE